MKPNHTSKPIIYMNIRVHTVSVGEENETSGKKKRHTVQGFECVNNQHSHPLGYLTKPLVHVMTQTE